MMTVSDNPQQAGHEEKGVGRSSVVLGLLLVFVVAGWLRAWDLSGHEFGNMYYAAAVRSMAMNWHNFLFGAFDPEGFITVDKPPVGLWPQVLSVWAFGYNGLALHLPQVVFGLMAVTLVFVLGLRLVGLGGAMIAGLVLATMPVSVAVDRSNMLDSLLTLLLLMAAMAWLRAMRFGNWRWLLLAGVIVGVAFNVKMLAAFVVLPTFYVLYLLAGPGGWGRRLGQLCVTTVVLFSVALSWPLYVDLTPASQRPYVGGSLHNSVMELSLGYNGIARITRMRPPDAAGPIGGAPGVRDGMGGRVHRAGPRHPGPPRMHGPGHRPPRMGPPRMPGGRGDHGLTGFGGVAGWARLANRELAGHIAWLFPLALIGTAAVAIVEPRRRPMSSTYHALLLMLGWLVTCATIFSFSSGIVHNYYLVLMAPPLAIVCGIGAVCLYRVLVRGRGWVLLPVVAIGLTAAWQSQLAMRYTEWDSWLIPTLAGGVILAGAILLTTWDSPPGVGRRWAGLGLGLMALLICPAIWSATVTLAPGARMVPIADPSLFDGPIMGEMNLEQLGGHGPPGPHVETARLIGFLESHRDGEQFVLAVPDIHTAAPIIIKSGLPVMAYGGFSGGDRVMTAQGFEAAVREGVVRYVLLGGGPPMGPPRNRELEAWVRAHGVPVPEAQWRGVVESRERPRMGAPVGVIGRLARHPRAPGLQLYDCRAGGHGA